MPPPRDKMSKIRCSFHPGIWDVLLEQVTRYKFGKSDLTRLEKPAFEKVEITEESRTWFTIQENVFAGAFWTVGIPKMSFEAPNNEKKLS